jgi:AraC-like DNA-binding protein
MNRYPWKLLPRLAVEIEYERRQDAHDDLESLLQITWRQEGNDLTLWKLRCSQIASACVRGALRGGAPSDIAMGEHLQLLQRLSSAVTRRSLQAQMRQYLDSLLDHVQPAQGSGIDRAVAQVRKSLQETLGVSQSLSQYARMLGVSEGHLSRCFAAISGQTYRAERRRIRLEAACQMLRQRRLKISVIAGQLGIADTSQFIADFRGEFGVTPGQYRRRNVEL